jgi:hypothetical protein
VTLQTLTADFPTAERRLPKIMTYDWAAAERAEIAACRDESEKAKAIGEVVYFVRIGKAIKIGHTKNLNKRLKSFRASSTEIMDVLASVPGGRKIERYFHKLFSHSRIRNEFFKYDFALDCFVNQIKRGELAAAINWMKAHKSHLDECAEHGRKMRFARQSRLEAQKNSPRCQTGPP